MLNLKSVIQPMDVLRNGHWNHASIYTGTGHHAISIQYDAAYPTGLRSGVMVYLFAVSAPIPQIPKKVSYAATSIAVTNDDEATIVQYRNAPGSTYRKFCCHYLDWYGAKVYHNGTQIN